MQTIIRSKRNQGSVARSFFPVSFLPCVNSIFRHHPKKQMLNEMTSAPLCTGALPLSPMKKVKHIFLFTTTTRLALSESPQKASQAPVFLDEQRLCITQHFPFRSTQKFRNILALKMS